jgi:hypothetical protein
VKLTHYCEKLELCQGNLEKLLKLFPEINLFELETLLQLPENLTLRKRWRKAIYISEKIRIDLLRCKALKILEDFNPESKSPVVMFSKTLLGDQLTEANETAKQRVFKAFGVNSPSSPDDTLDELEKELINGSH